MVDPDDGWAGAEVLEPRVGVAGHSRGALAGLQLVVQYPKLFRAFAALSGAWDDTTEGISVNSALTEIDLPSLFMFGTGEKGSTPDPDPNKVNYRLPRLWSHLHVPKHSIQFGDVQKNNAQHYDYLPPKATCGGEYERGPCAVQWLLTRDILTTFFSKYIAPVGLPQPLNDSLVPLRPDELLAVSAKFPSKSASDSPLFFLGGGYRSGSAAYGSNSSQCFAVIRWQAKGDPHEGITQLPIV